MFFEAKIREKIEYDDLEGEESSSSAPALKLARLDPYLHGPTPVIAMQYSTSEDMIHACQAFTQEMMAWQSQQTQVYISHTKVFPDHHTVHCEPKNCTIFCNNFVKSFYNRIILVKYFYSRIIIDIHIP